MICVTTLSLPTDNPRILCQMNQNQLLEKVCKIINIVPILKLLVIPPRSAIRLAKTILFKFKLAVVDILLE